tara:strand:- start:5251 stop:6126 length:876 start_codon:yes stop_codon:yes gene_type:complete
MIEELKPLLGRLTSFAKDRLKFEHPPRLFLRKDLENSRSILGKTAHYDPAEKSITLFVVGRHPKDILRSFCHELVHHCQNERGDLAFDKMKTMNKNYAQENPHMRKMEEEAYLQGNMCFRDWEDSLENKMQFRMMQAEQKFLKENKNMSVKISKKELKGLIEKLLGERVEKDSKEINEVEEELEEGGCVGGKASPGKKKDKYMMDESDTEEINETEEDIDEAVDQNKDGKNDFDDVKVARMIASGMSREEALEAVGESKIHTPEQENALYEERFTPRNNKLFERLVKKWTK